MCILKCILMSTSPSEEVVNDENKEAEEYYEDKDVEEGFELKTKCIEENKISAKYEELVQEGIKDYAETRELYLSTCKDFVTKAYKELRGRDIAPEVARKIVTYDARIVVGWAYKTINDVMPDEAKNEKMAALGRRGAEIKRLKRGLGSENMDKSKIQHIASLGGKGKAESFRVKKEVEKIADLTEEMSTKELEEFDYVLEVDTEVLERILNKAKETESKTVKFILKELDGQEFAIRDYQLTPKRTEMI
jgi:hypothetical protein